MALTWMKSGAASVAVAQKEAVEAQMRREESGKLFRFWLNKEETAKVTFVDGDINPEYGCLTPPRFFEHSIFNNGEWQNYICPEKTSPDSGDVCPLCASGDRPSLVAVFTVIDHRSYTSKKDKDKVYVNTKKVFVAKSQTFEMLNKIAVKRGGLACARFEISRVGDKSPQVGSMFEFEEKLPIEQLKGLYVIEKTDPKQNTKTKVTNFEPADYEKEFTFRTGAELAKLGLGVPSVSAGVASPAGSNPAAVDYSSQL